MKRSLMMAAALLASGCGTPAAVPTGAPVPVEAYPTVAPRPGAAPSVDVPDPVSRTLANGLTVLYVRRDELPVVQARLVTRGGQTDDPTDLPGLAAFTASLLDEGAAGMDALQLASAVDLLGASLNTSAGWDAANVGLYVLRSRLGEGLQLMADVVVRPDFPQKEIDRVREQTLTDLIRARDVPGAVAERAFPMLVYGDRHPYGLVATTEGIRSIDRERLRAFHQRYYRPGGATLVLVGDVNADEVHPLVERAFGGWSAGEIPAVAALTPPEPAASRIYLIDKPGAAQSEVRIGHPGVARDHPDYFPLLVMNTMLGGSFTSRLNQNLRETHGYSYGARSSFAMRRGAGPFTASAAVVTAKTDSAVIEFFNELNRIRTEPVTGDELQRARNYVALGLPRSLETNPAVAGSLADLSLYGLDASFYDRYVERVMAVTAEDVARVANRYVRPDRSVIVIVGDRATIEPALRATGVAPVEIREVSEFVR